MPGTFNPVSGNPVAGVPHAKSFRTLLGFGSSNGGGSSIKPSFFSQLNLKAGRKSFGGPTDCQNDHSVLIIDPKVDEGGTCQENRVVLNDETDPSRPGQKSMKPYSSSPSKASSRHNISRSLPTTPVDTKATSYSLNSHTDLDMSFVKGATSEARVDPNNSSLSKAFPDLSADLSLLIDEQLPPDTASQSDHHPDSQGMVMNTGSSVFAIPQRVVTLPPFPDLSPTELDQTQRGGFTARVVPPSEVPRGVHGPSRSTIRRSAEDAMENTTASFDLSSARLSLDLMRPSLDEDWARSVLIENSSVPSADTSALLPPDSSLKISGSGPIASTPFLSPSASPSLSQHKERDVSFDLDALDPDLVALLRPNSANQGRSQMNRVVTPSPLEPFAPPPDPLNPVTTMQQPGITSSPSASPSSSTAYTKQEASMPSPIRKFATISASSSPARQLRLPRSYTAQDIFPPSKSSKSPKPSLAVSANVDMTWKDVRARDDGRPSPASATTFSENGAKSDISKQPSPLSATPLTLDDLQHNPDAVESSARPNFTLNITTRRKGRVAMPAPVQSPSPVSVLASSVDSRSAAHYVPGSRDRDFRPASASPEIHAPYSHAFGSTGRERERARPSMDGLFSKPSSPERCAGRPGSAGTGPPPVPFHARLNSHVFSHSRDRDWDLSAERRYRKRSMSLDQSSSGVERRADDFHSKGINSRYRGQGDRERLAESVGQGGSEYAHSVASGLGTPYDTRDPDRDQDRYGYGYGHSDRERLVRPQTDWLGPRTVKAFAAAGLLDDTRDTGSRYGGFTRSASDRDFRTPGSRGSRERRSPVLGGFPFLDAERDRNSLAFSGRTQERDFRSSGARSGAASPSNTVSARSLSRNDSWSHSRPAPLLARNMSDLMSNRGSADGRDSASGAHPRTGSVYSVGGGGTGGGSTGSGGGRASPTTTSSLFAIQSQIQSLKEKHDTQTEALLAALADSQRLSRVLKEENEALKSQVRSLEERLVESITNSRHKEKELSRALRTRLAPSPDRTRTVMSHRDMESSLKSRPPPSTRPSARSTPSPTKRRPSTSSSVFPPIPGSMSLLMAEKPGSPLHGSFGSGSGSGSSPPPSPTLVLPRLASKPKSPVRDKFNGDNVTPVLSSQPVTASHKRSTSGASVATSTNFSFETGSPGSLKLKPEHELLLGDMTRLSLVTGFDCDSEVET